MGIEKDYATWLDSQELGAAGKTLQGLLGKNSAPSYKPVDGLMFTDSNQAPASTGWSYYGSFTPRSTAGRLSLDGGRPEGQPVYAWRESAAAPAPAAPAVDAVSFGASQVASQQAQIDATLAANSQAAAAARAQYEAQTGQLTSSITELQGLLLKSKEDSAAALADQQRSFGEYMLKSDLNLATMKADYASQARAATAVAPTPEPGAVAPVLGDLRMGARNNAANTLSSLRIIAPGLLDGKRESVMLGGI
jgi:hypothetical protein